MLLIDRMRRIAPETWGLWYGFLGVLAFSLTLPATRAAVGGMDPMLVGIGRPAAAALVAGALLLITRQPFPQRAHLKGLFLVGFGISVAFPVLAAWAMRDLPSSHGGVLIGILPLATAVVAALRAGERPSRTFWLAGMLGSTTVVGFALYQGAGHLQSGDLLLFVALLFGALGYAEGGKLARHMDGWKVISWSLVICSPLTIIPTLVFLATQPVQVVSPAAWVGFTYVVLVSQFLGFFPWYRGMALAGVARVGQIQLLQPFITIVASALLLGERITPLMIGTALVVCCVVWVGRRAPIYRPGATQDTQPHATPPVKRHVTGTHPVES